MEIVFKVNKRSNYIIALPMLFLLMPRPEIAGIQFLTYPLMVILVLFMVISMTKNMNFVLDKRVFILSMYLLISTIFVLLSLLYNSSLEIGHLAKPILFATILYFGYFISRNNEINVMEESLLKLAYIVILVQVVVGVTQLFGMPIFSLLYSMEKTRPLGEIVRIAGTLGNPNLFSWVIIQMSVIIWLFEKNSLKKVTFVLIALALVFLSGSRSLLLIFPVLLIFTEVMSKKKNTVFFFLKIPIYIVAIFLFGKFAYWFMLKFGSTFPYMYQLLNIFETGDLSSINSYEARTFTWRNGLNELNSWVDWLFGIGGTRSTLDSDYLFALINFGLFYLIINLLMYVTIFYYFLKIKNRAFRTLGVQYILFSLVIGFQSETLSGWNYPILIMFYAGIAITILRHRNEKEVFDSTKSKKKRYRIKW